MNKICQDCEYKNVPSLDLPCCICDKFDNYPNTKIIEVLNLIKTKIKFNQNLQQGEGDFYNGMEIASNNDLNVIDSIIDSIREETINDTIKELEKIKGRLYYIHNSGMGKNKSIEYIEKYINGEISELKGYNKMKDNKYKSRDVNFIGTITDSSETIINHNGRILQDALDRIEQLEKELAELKGERE